MTLVRHKPREIPAHTKALAERLEQRGARDVHAYSTDGLRIVTAQWPTGPADELEWHASIAHPDRYPTFEELCHVRAQLLPEGRTYGTVIPGALEPTLQNTIHLWEIPRRRADW